MRTLVSALDTLQIRPQRRPRWRVEIYDVRSTSDEIGDVVTGATLDSMTGPRDFTSDVVSLTINERAGNFVDTGIPATTVSFSVVDPHNQFDPFNLIGSPTGDGRWLRRNNVLRIYEGDADVDEADWPITFTGVLIGQAGVDQNRTSSGAGILQMQAVGREVAFLQQSLTSSTFGAAESYLSAGITIAQEDMGLDLGEIDLSGWGSQTFAHTVNQFVDQSPLVSIAQLMFVDGFMPRFDGEGKLSQVQGNITAAPSRIYANEQTLRSVITPFSNENPVNRVCVIGLDAAKTKITQPRQELGRITMTIGYFTTDISERIYWSEDRTQLAENIKFKIETSVNGLLQFSEEESDDIPAPNMGEGTIGAKLTATTGYAPYIIIFLAVFYVLAAAIPDFVLFGVTVPAGRITQALLLTQILIIMASIGRGVYVWSGEPFEYVFKTIEECAEVDGLLTSEFNEEVIENHLVNDRTDARNSAREVLFRQQARGRPRTVQMIHDLRLEPDDLFERSNGRIYLIESISRTLERSGENPVIASLRCFETTPGIGAVV